MTTRAEDDSAHPIRRRHTRRAGAPKGRRRKGLVFDSWAVLAYLQGEDAAEHLADVLAEAIQAEAPILMSVVNVGEVWYILAREVSTAEADKSVATLRSWGVEFVAADWTHAKEAASLKSRYKMSYADAFAAALAKARKAELVTGDPEFEQIGDYASIRWLRNEG